MRNAAFVALALVALAGCGRAEGQAKIDERPAQKVQAAALANRPTLAALRASSIIAGGVVLPRQSANVNFEINGVVTAILVEEGAEVGAGEPIARLDARDLELNVAQAETAVAQARANEQQLRDGATPAEIAQAQAQVDQARAQLLHTQGSVSAADISAAQARLAEAQAARAQLEAGPASADVASAQALRDQAQADLHARRDQLSAAKTSAQLDLQQSTVALGQAQARYATALQEWQRAQAGGDNSPLLSDGLTRAETELRAAEIAVQQAQLALDTARQAEVSGVQSAEARLRDADARLAKLLGGADAASRSAVEAQVAQAQAQLDQLRGAARAGSLDAATASVSLAEANLGALTAAPRATELAAATAQVQAAEVRLAQARLILEKATLRAPFAGTVARININVGEAVGQQMAAVVLADFSAWKIETDDLTEFDIVQVREGALATITFEALPDLVMLGRVSEVAAVGNSAQDDVTYTVTVVSPSWDERLRWNMTATVAIRT